MRFNMICRFSLNFPPKFTDFDNTTNIVTIKYEVSMCFSIKMRLNLTKPLEMLKLWQVALHYGKKVHSLKVSHHKWPLPGITPYKSLKNLVSVWYSVHGSEMSVYFSAKLLLCFHRGQMYL